MLICANLMHCGLGKLGISQWSHALQLPSKVLQMCLSSLASRIQIHKHVASMHTEFGDRSMQELYCHTVLQMLAEKVRLARKEVKAAQNLILQAELKARRRVLRRLGYVDSDGVVTVKGRAAAEIQSADELVLTELMFSGVFKVNVAKSARVS